MGNSPTRASRKRESKEQQFPVPPKVQKTKNKLNDDSTEASDSTPKQDDLSKLLQGTPLHNVEDNMACNCSFSSDSEESSAEDSSSEYDPMEEIFRGMYAAMLLGGHLADDTDDDNSSEEEETEDNDSADEIREEGNDDSSEEKDEKECKSENSQKVLKNCVLPTKDAEGLPPLSGLKRSKSDESDSDDDFYMNPEVEKKLNKLYGLNGSSESLDSWDKKMSPSDCEVNDWSPSTEEFCDMIYGVERGEGGDETFIKNLANILWDKHVLASSYIPSIETGVDEFTTFMPTRQPICQKRLEILKRQWFYYKVSCEALSKEIDMEKANQRAGKIEHILATYIASLNSLGGFKE